MDETKKDEASAETVCVDHDFTDSEVCVKCGAPQTLGIHIKDEAKTNDKFGGYK
jgi:hypothetical protein